MILKSAVVFHLPPYSTSAAVLAFLDRHLSVCGKQKKFMGVFLTLEVTAPCRKGPAVMEDHAARREAGQKKLTGLWWVFWPLTTIIHPTTHTHTTDTLVQEQCVRSCWWTCFPDSHATLACGFKWGNAPGGTWNWTTCSTRPLQSRTPSLLRLPNIISRNTQPPLFAIWHGRGVLVSGGLHMCLCLRCVFVWACVTVHLSYQGYICV